MEAGTATISLPALPPHHSTSGMSEFAAADLSGTQARRSSLLLLGKKNLLLILSVIGMLLGYTSGTLLVRFYFANGGSRKWLYAWSQTAGWPLTALATGIVYWRQNLKMAAFTPRLVSAYLLLGGLLAVDSFTYAWGAAYMSASTNALLWSSQLIFTAIFACLLNRQKITPYGYNAIALVTTSAVLLAIHSNSDKPPGVTKKQYVVAYIVTIGSSALYGFIIPLTELVFRKVLSKASKHVILEVQLFVSFTATAFSMVGMAVNRDFSALHAESLRFKPGPAAYYLGLFWTTVSLEIGFLSSMGVIFLSSSLLSGVVVAASLPLASALAVVFFHDNFGALKIIALFLSLWGFTSYIYGGYLRSPMCCNSFIFYLETKEAGRYYLEHETSLKPATRNKMLKPRTISSLGTPSTRRSIYSM